MEIIIGAVVIVGALYYIWSKSNKSNTVESAEIPAKTETVVTGDLAFEAPAEEKPVQAPVQEAKPAKTRKPKAAAMKAAPKAEVKESKPKAPRKPKMKVAK